MTKTVRGTYGSLNIPCNVFVYVNRDMVWYAVEGSSNVNGTYEQIEDGVDIEKIHDCEYFSWKEDINSEDDLVIAVEA